MAHVLIDGESGQLQEVHSCLRRWGLTVGRLPAGARARGCASRAECDVVVFLCQEDQAADEPRDSHLKSVPEGDDAQLANPEPAAPLLVIGRGPLAEIMGRQACRSIPEPGQRGSLLHEALEFCLSGRNTAGTPGGGGRDSDQQLHFLGHELRSPLTAIKTALEVIQGDSWRPGCGESRDPEPGEASRLRMLEIALRNVRRMHHTVDWSQNLMQFEDSRAGLQRRTVTLDGLSDALAIAGCGEVRATGGDQAIECDTDLFLHVAGQAVQAVRCDDPELPVEMTLDLESAGSGRLRMRILRAVSERDVDPDCPAPDRRELVQHLQRFADFLNPTGALLQAYCDVRVCRESGDGIGLALTIECCPVRQQSLTLVG